MSEQTELSRLLDQVGEEEAKQIARRMLEENPQNVKLLRNAALDQRGAFETSIAVLKEIIDFNPLDLITRDALAATYSLMGEDDLVEKECQTILSIDPNFAEAYGMLASVAETRGEDPQVVESLYRRAADLAPDVWYHHANLARVYRRNNKIHDAIAEMQRALSCPNVQPRERQRMERELADLEKKRTA